ncbi:MAG: ABC transporter substrate-binding protein [Desulfobacteraceae bacterium]|nr:ABC transporter substrate-binding protein [Desulfobacteraceae bacterium]
MPFLQVYWNRCAMNKTRFFYSIILLTLIHSVCTAQTIPDRVISLSPIITETIYLVGAEHKLIANTNYCNVPKAAINKEKIGSVTHMNVEKIISLKPDLVIASALSREKQLMILENQSINILRAQNPRTFDQMCDMTVLIGEKLGRKETAGNIVDKAKKQADYILSLTQGLEKPSVFMQIGLKPLHSANKDMFINEYIRYAGGINIAENESSGIYSREKVLTQNPQIILIATMGSSKKAGLIERERWMTFKTMAAVKHNRVYVLDPEMICSPTPTTFVKGLHDLLPIIHPGLEQTISPERGKQ